jgi:hypothetical protein
MITQHTLTGWLPDVTSVLQRAGVGFVAVSYAGQFDFERVEAPVFLSTDRRLLLPNLEHATADEVRVFLREWLDGQRPGWGNAEGSEGELEWDLTAQQLSHRHCLRSLPRIFEDIDAL